MRKLLFLIVAISAIGVAQAQLTDTVMHRNRNYYYSQWYDTCKCCYNGTNLTDDYACLFLRDATGGWGWGAYAVSDYTPRPLNLLGVAAMVMEPVPWYRFLSRDSVYGEEYVYVAYYDSATNQMQILDSARWDTLQPKTMAIRLTETPEYYMVPASTCPPDGIAYCRVYEAYFKKPVTVDSVFYLIGTHYGNRQCQEPLYLDHSEKKRVVYAEVSTGMYFSCVPLSPPQKRLTKRSTHDWSVRTWPGSWGPFLPIIEPQYLLEVHSADTAMGHVTGRGFCIDSTEVWIEAEPKYGYVFTHWNDGDTANPRLVTVTSDTAFTAYFAEAEYFRVSANAYPPEYGFVEGGGNYPQNTDTVIVARVVDNLYRFVEWHDHDSTNPRRVRVVQDTTFTAIFGLVEDSSGHQGVEATLWSSVDFRLVPNPATNMVQCETEDDGFRGGVLTVADAAGRKVLRKELAQGTQSLIINVAELPAGTYFVTLVTAEGMGVKKLVVE